MHVSHIKLGMRDPVGSGRETDRRPRSRAQRGRAADGGHLPLHLLAVEPGRALPEAKFRRPWRTEFVLAHVALAEDIIFNSFRAHPDYAGKTLAQVAALRGTPAARTLMDPARRTRRRSAGIVAKGMSDGDVERLIQWPFVNVCSDGPVAAACIRAASAPSRVLGSWVRDKRLFRWRRRSARCPVCRLRMPDRQARPDRARTDFADLVVFDPSTVADRADFGRAQHLAVGVRTVWSTDRSCSTMARRPRPIRAGRCGERNETQHRPSPRRHIDPRRPASELAAQDVVDGFVARSFKASNGDTMPSACLFRTRRRGPNGCRSSSIYTAAAVWDGTTKGTSRAETHAGTAL